MVGTRVVKVMIAANYPFDTYLLVLLDLDLPAFMTCMFLGLLCRPSASGFSPIAEWGGSFELRGQIPIAPGQRRQ